MTSKKIITPYGTILGDVFTSHAGDELEVAWVDGEPKFMGCLPPKVGFGGLPDLADHVELIPRSEWRDISFRGYDVPTENQARTNSCVGRASVVAFWRQWLIQNLPLPLGGFSACWTYGLINGGRDGGAVISDAMDSMMTDGVALLKDVPEGMIYTSWVKNRDAVAATAKRFRVARAFHCGTVDEIGTAIQRGLMVVCAVRASSGWSPDPDTGIPPLLRGGGNHAQHLLGMKSDPKHGWLFEDQNSWGADWGNDGGYCLLTESHVDCGSQDAFAIQFDLPDPQSPHEFTAIV